MFLIIILKMQNGVYCVRVIMRENTSGNIKENIARGKKMLINH